MPIKDKIRVLYTNDVNTPDFFVLSSISSNLKIVALNVFVSFQPKILILVSLER